MAGATKVRKQRRRKRCAPQRFVPVVELLEDRVVPATVQFDVQSAFNADVIVNAGLGSIDTVQNPVDLAGQGSNHAFMTQDAADLLGGTAIPNGLPDDAFFPAGYYHPDVQLAYSDFDNGLNARRADTDTGLSAFDFTFGVPNAPYSQIHLFLTAGDLKGWGLHATAQVTLTYTDSSTSTTTIDIPDWLHPFSDDEWFGGYNLITGLDRNSVDASSYDDVDSASIYGFGIAANPSKRLESVTIDSVTMPDETGNTGSIVFFGAAGVLAPSVTLSGPSAIKAGQAYTLDLDYDSSVRGGNLSINWGDGTVDEFTGLPDTATHVYQTTPSLNTISATLYSGEQSYPSLNTLDVSVPTFDVSGNSSVLVGQTYTLGLQYTPSEASNSVSHVLVNWGDGTLTDYEGAPSSVTHVYTDAPNGYIINARAFGVFGQIDAPTEPLVTVTVPEDGNQQTSEVVERGNTETITLGGIEVTVSRARTDLHGLIITLANYQVDPVDDQTNTVTTVGGRTFITTPLGTFVESVAYDLRATIPEPGDVIVARFTIPAGDTAPALFYFDPAANMYLPVHGSTKIPDSYVQIGNVIQVIFDETSFPTEFQLGGTVFTITDARAALPLLVNINLQAPPPRPPVNNNDLLGSLLDTGGNRQDTTTGTVGIVAPTQVNAFQPQNITSAAESPEAAEGRRLSRQIQFVLDGVYEQMRNVFLPQLYFNPDAVTPLPEAEEAVPDAEPVWLYEDVALTPTPAVAPEEIAIPATAQPEREAAPTRAWLFDERTLVCLSLAALPMFAAGFAPATQKRKKRKQRTGR